VIFGIFFMLPFAWYISTALKPSDEVYLLPLRWIPSHIAWDNFSRGFSILPFWLYAKNTLVIVTVVLVGTLVSSTLVAYGFARFRAKGSIILFTLLLSTMMLPTQVTLIPTYILFNALGWLQTSLPLMVPSFFATGAFYVFLLRQFFVTIPKEMEEAANIDGCGVLRTLLQIFLPLCIPALTTVALFTVINTWNDFMNQLIYLNSDKQYTIAVGLSFFNNKYGPQQVNLLMAVSFATIIPLLILFFIGQKYFVEGIVTSGLKG
jgi:multiple sugar transport system permease protein